MRNQHGALALALDTADKLETVCVLELQQGHQVNIINAARFPDMSFSLTNPGLLRYTGTKQQRCTGP